MLRVVFENPKMLLLWYAYVCFVARTVCTTASNIFGHVCGTAG